MFAERAHLWSILFVAGCAVVGLVAANVMSNDIAPPQGRVTVVSVVEVVPDVDPPIIVGIPPAQEPCPVHVRAAMKLDDSANLICTRVETGTSVVGFYRTTEMWQRTAIVADNGRLLSPLIDSPTLPQ